MQLKFHEPAMPSQNTGMDGPSLNDVEIGPGDCGDDGRFAFWEKTWLEIVTLAPLKSSNAHWIHF